MKKTVTNNDRQKKRQLQTNLKTMKQPKRDKDKTKNSNKKIKKRKDKHITTNEQIDTTMDRYKIEKKKQKLKIVTVGRKFGGQSKRVT